MKVVLNVLTVIFTLIGIAALLAIYYNRHIKKRYIIIEN